MIRAPTPSFETAVTEVIVLTPNAGVARDTLAAAVGKASDVLNDLGHPSALGESVGGDGVYLIVIGWPSVAVRVHFHFILSIF